MRVLSLDASTTTIGLAVLDCDLNSGYTTLVHLEYYQPPKIGNIFHRLQQVRQYIQKNIDVYKPDEVALEDIVLFMKNHSTATTISSLAVLNRTVGLAVLDKLGKPPHLYNVLSIRHAIKDDKKLPAKEEIPELISRILKIPFPYVFNKKGNKIVQNQDMADACAVGLAYLFFVKNPKKDPENKKAKTK